MSAAKSAEEYEAEFRMALDLADAARPRSRQTDGGVLGASDAGQCVHKAVLTVRETPPTDVPRKGKARIGTALHSAILTDVADAYPERMVEKNGAQIELHVTLPSGVVVPLHPDEIDPTEPSVTDAKFTGDIDVLRRNGPTEAQHMQRNMQYLAAYQAGIITSLDGVVRNLYVSMTDADDVYVQQEPFSMAWIERADEWYRAVIYAVEHGEDGSRDWPEAMCRGYCPFFTMCRGADVPDANNPITNPDLVRVAQLALEARDKRKEWARIEEQAVEALKGVTGRAGDVRVVSTTVNGAQRSYVKVDLRRVS